MRKFFISLVLCFFAFNFLGCNSAVHNATYSDDSKIASNEDRYYAKNSFSNISNGQFDMTATMSGAETIWMYDADSDMDADITYSLSILESGKVKLVLITPDDKVSIIEEVTDVATDVETKIETLSLKKGKNRIKIVAYDSPRFELKAKMDIGNFRGN